MPSVVGSENRLQAGARRAPAGFTMIEILMVVAVVGIVVAISLPRVGLSRYQASAAARTVTAAMAYAQRLAVSQQSNVNVALDVANRRLRLHEDADNDLVVDPGERVTYAPLGEAITFGRSGAPARAFGGNAIEMTRLQGGMPVLTFRRDGTASEEAGFYLTTIAGQRAGHTHDARAVEISRATGRAAWFSYGSGQWKRGD